MRVDLGGTWCAAIADEALRRAYPAPSFDDGGWEPIDVPSHWRTTPAFADTDGPVLYRTGFDTPATPPGAERWWLCLDGMFYDGDVWLDGSYVGATEGYFFPHTFEVTGHITAGGEHVLGVEVGCNPQGDKAKRALTGVFQSDEDVGEGWNPGGIWRPVHLASTGPVRISRLRVLCAEAMPERARLNIRAVLDATAAQSVLLRAVVRLGDSETHRVSRHALAHGDNRIEFAMTVDNPALWWPRALGDQPLYDVEVDVLTPTAEPADAPPRRRGRRPDTDVTDEDIAGHVPSDTRHVQTGMRRVTMRDWIATVNGERLFLKGSNLAPTRAALAAATPDEIEADVRRAADIGLDLLRVRGHVSRPELYDAADRLGVLLWQDMPLQWGYARSVRRQAVRQAREAVDLLGHHAAVAVWCGHNEPFDPTPERSWRRIVWEDRPTWNKTVLDGSVGRALQRADPTRPVAPHTGTGPDSHMFVGWYHGEVRDLPSVLAAVPRLARFISEFGAQAVPSWATTASSETLDRRVPRAGTFDAWRTRTQQYQAEVIRFHIETLRRLKYRPAGGFCQLAFADAAPAAVSFAVLDHERAPKEAYEVMQHACAPVIVVAERPLESYELGAPLELDVHVINDLRRPLTATVRAALGDQRWGWVGEVGADDCVRVGTVRGVAVPGELVLTMSAGATEAYRTTYPIGITPS